MPYQSDLRLVFHQSTGSDDMCIQYNIKYIIYWIVRFFTRDFNYMSTAVDVTY